MAQQAQRTAMPETAHRPAAPGALKDEAAPSTVIETPLVAANGDDGSAVARHAALLGDPRLHQPASQAQRVQLMRQLQRGHGNAHVARVMARMQQTAAAGGAIQRADCPPAAVERPPVAPEQDASFRGVTAKVAQVATKEKQHPPAKAKAAEAQAAATGPTNEVASQAAAGQVEKMGQQRPGAFDKQAFVAAVRAAIAAATPKNLDEAEKYKSSGKAGQVKGQVAGLVKGGKETAEKDIKETAKAAPDASGARPKPVTPMKPEQPGAPPGPVGAAGAMPKPKAADEVDLKHDQCATDGQMKEAGVTEQQLAKSNEPGFNDALAAKKQADAHTATAPAAYRADEKATLDQAKADATGVAGAQVAGMHGGRAGALAQVAGQKAATKAKDEADRAKVAADLEAIYGKTKADVAKILDGLEGKVTTAFDAGEKAAREAMEQHIDSKTTDFKLKRYLLQPGGSLLWIADQFSKPPELDAIVDAGVKLFTGRMDTVINQVADIVAAELTAARNRIAQGRTEVKQHVAGLPKNLQTIGQEAAAALTDKFDQLDQDVTDKQASLVDSLAQKYVEARDAANERAKELRDSNKGLWAKAQDAVGGVIETIKNLKAMLEGVLAKAAGVIDKIIADPIQFLSNLVSAVKMGLNQFVSNIGSHLKKGLMGWLFGTLAEAGIQMPESFDLKGILSLVLQLLGLTYANIRARAVKVVGEQVVAGLEKTVEIFKTLVTEGPAGLWKFIQDKLAGLKDQVMDQIKDFVITKVITAGITWLISMLNPASAFVKACKAIYDVVMFFVERGSQIMGLVNSILDGIGAIASGALGGAANLVEQALGKAVPVAISFLASLLGLGGIAGKIKSVIEAIQAPVNKAIDAVIGGALKLFKKLGGDKVIKAVQKGVTWTKDKIKQGKDWVKKKAQGAKDWAKKKLGIDDSPEGKQKRLVQGVEAGARAVGRFAGKLVGKAILTPLLGALRLRYRLAVLEPVQQGEFWAVHGEISRMTLPTKAKAGAAGDADKDGFTRDEIARRFGHELDATYVFALTGGVWSVRRGAGQATGPDAKPEKKLVYEGGKGKYRLEHQKSSGTFSLAPGGLGAHEGQKIPYVLKGKMGTRTIHVVSNHGPGAAGVRLPTVVSAFHTERAKKIATWNDTINTINTPRIAKWTLELNAEKAKATPDPARVTELTDKITRATNENTTITGKITHVTGILDTERDKIQDWLFNEAGRRDIPFQETEFVDSGAMESTIASVVRDNQSKIDKELHDASGTPQPVGFVTKAPLRQSFRNNVGVGYRLDASMNIEKIPGELKTVAVVLVVSDSAARQFKVFSAWPE